MAAILAGYLFVTAAILGAGLWFPRRLRLSLTATEHFALGWVIGAAFYSLLLIALCALHTIQRPILMAAGIAGIALACHSRPTIPRPAWPAGIAAIFLVIYFIAALAPSLDSDGYRYHLGFPRLYLDAGGLIPIREDFYSAFPQGMEMLYLFALPFGGFSVANLLHWNFFAALTAGVYATGLRIGSPMAAACASIAVASSSVIGSTAASASVDVALAAAIWVSVHAWLRSIDEPASPWFILASIAAGFACSIKYTGVTALLVSALFLLFHPRSLRRVSIAAAIAAIWIAPWLIRNWIYFDNPVHPFLSAWFPNPNLLPSSERTWIEVVQAYNGAAFGWSYPWEAAIRGVATAGFTGPFFLLAPISLFALRCSRKARLLLAAGLITAAAWVFGNPITRFAIPTLPFLALAICLTLDRVPRAVLISIVAFHAALCFPPTIERWNKQWIPAVKSVPWRQALRFESPESFWSREIPAYSAVRFVESHSGSNARVLAFDDQPQFFTSRLLANPYSSEQSSFADHILRRAADSSSWPSVACTAHVSGPPFRFIRLIQQEADRYAEWTIFEATSAASYRAEPNPWDAPLAGDANHVTAWSSKTPRTPGMWFEIEWTAQDPSRDIRIVSSPAHRGRMAIAISANGRDWSPVPTELRCETIEVTDFPRRSTAELARRGWTHLMTGRDVYPWLPRALSDPAQWGIRERFYNGPVRVFEIDPMP